MSSDSCWIHTSNKCLDLVLVHQEVNTIFQTLMINSSEFMKEKLDVYIQRRQTEIQDFMTQKGLQRDKARLAFEAGLFSSTFSLLTVNSRNYLIRILSSLNYQVSVRLLLIRREKTVRLLEERFDEVEAIRFCNMQGLIRKKQQEVSKVSDDMKLLEYSNFETSRSKRKQSLDIPV